jgi:ELWxxDGT repeat protein
MKKMLRCLFAAVTILPAYFSSAQVTKLANNNNITAGITLGNIAVMIDNKDSLWKTDGTPAGTKKYAANVALDTNENVVYYKNKLFFAGVNASKGIELWVTDGTTTGTKLIKDINTGAASSSPANFFVFNNTMYFFASTSAKGKELWKSDGTASGTVLVKDINPGAGSSFTQSSYFFTNNNILYFVANDGTHGEELWKTNGTGAGTVLLKDINPNAASSNAAGFTALGTLVLFSADDGTNGQELWKTDGTAAGTKLVKDIATGFPGFGSSPSGFFEFKSKLYFTAFDLTNGGEMWVTDGSTSGTKLIKDIYPGVNSSVPLLAFAIIVNNKFYFSATSSKGTELWQSDGTSGGTILFKDINAGAGSSNPVIWLNFFGGGTPGFQHETLFNGKIFFQANDGTHGTEPWITDGTTANTKMVKDIRAGSGSSVSSFSYFYTTTDLYFSANNGSKGEELWKSNGTGAGTSIVKDINAGSGSSSPLMLYVILNKHLLFTANDGDNTKGNTDLYKLNATVDTLSFASAIAVSIAPDGSSFSIYPNPAKDELHLIINNTNTTKGAIAITDENGSQLYRQPLSNLKGSYQYNINIHSFAAGLYYLQFITEKGVKTEKFIKAN